MTSQEATKPEETKTSKPKLDDKQKEEIVKRNLEESIQPEKKTHEQRELIKQQLIKELERYFDPQNFSRDAYLKNNTDYQGYIPIRVLLGISLISDLTKDEDLIIEAIKNSKKLKYDSDKRRVKTAPRIERTTLILRDIPTKVGVSEIKKIFAHKECAEIKEIRPDIGNTWFVKFYSEEDCLRTVKFLQKNGKFGDQPLHIRVKSASVYPAHLPATSTSTSTSTATSSQPFNNDYLYPNQYLPPTGPYFESAYTDQSPIIGAIDSPSAIAAVGGINLSTLSPYQIPLSGPSNINKNDNVIRKATITKTTTKDKTSTKSSPQRQSSDYPGDFALYQKDALLALYPIMKGKNDLEIPQSMRGRDHHIVSEDISSPETLKPKPSNEEITKPMELLNLGSDKKKNTNEQKVNRSESNFYDHFDSPIDSNEPLKTEREILPFFSEKPDKNFNRNYNNNNHHYENRNWNNNYNYNNYNKQQFYNSYSQSSYNYRNYSQAPHNSTTTNKSQKMVYKPKNSSS